MTHATLSTAQADFIGRDDDLRRLRSLLAAEPLVTVLGPGGMGKTRLAQEAGRSLEADFPGGVWFCDLVEARTEEGILHAVAATMNIPLPAADPGQRLGQALEGHGRCLIILDNFEQIVDFAEQTVGMWHATAPEARFLVTSRTALQLSAEHLFPLDALSTEDGAALFCQRARAAGATVKAEAVGALVEALDCMPLAIEMAAAHARIFSPAALLARMNQRFRLLRKRTRGGPARHRSMENTLRWSWDLLSPWEQSALSQLSVFHGGFTLKSAEAIMDLSDFEDAPWPPVLIEALVEKSWLRTLGVEHGPPRLGTFVSVQEFIHRIAPPPAEALARHAGFFAALGTPASLYTWDGSIGLTNRPEAFYEIDNLAAALERALTGHDSGTAGGCLLALGVLYRKGHLMESLLSWMPRVLEQTPRGSLRARLQCTNTWLLAHHKRNDEAIEAGEDGLVSCTIAPNPETQTQLWAFLLLAAMPHNRAAEIETYSTLLRTHLRDPERARTRPKILLILAMLEGEKGNCREAATLAREAVALYREHRNTFSLLGALNVQAIIHTWLDERQIALTCFEEALALDVSFSLSRLRLQLNHAALLGTFGRLTEAHSILTGLVQEYRRLGSTRELTMALLGLAHCCVQMGRYDEARTLAGEALEKARVLSFLKAQGRALIVLGELTKAEGNLDQAAEQLRSGLDILRRAAILPLLLDGLGLLVELEKDRLPRLVPPLLTEGSALADKMGLPPDHPGRRPFLAPPSPEGLRVGEGVRWVEVAGLRVDLKRKQIQRALLSCLLTTHRERPGEAVEMAQLCEAGWPESRLAPDTLANRAYVAIHALRKSGLTDIIQSHGDGYRIDPHITQHPDGPPQLHLVDGCAQ